MKTFKLIILVITFCITAGFIGTSNAEAWPRHRHFHRRLVVRTYVHPTSTLVWVEGHWKFNKFGQRIWKKGHWKKVYRY